MTQSQTDPQNDLQKNGKVIKENEPTQAEQPTKPDPVKQKPWQKIPRPLLIIGAVLLLAGVGYGVYRLFFYSPDAPALSLSGRIEGYETDVSAKIGGRVAQVSAREGDTVKSGQILVQIDDSDLRAQLQGAIARVRAIVAPGQPQVISLAPEFITPQDGSQKLSFGSGSSQTMDK